MYQYSRSRECLSRFYVSPSEKKRDNALSRLLVSLGETKARVNRGKMALYMSWLGADLPKYSTTIISNLQSLYIIVLTEQSNILVTQPGF